MGWKRFVPGALASAYHRMWAWGAALWYGFPSDKITVIAITGTKGKTSTTEMLASICRAAGKKTALINSLHMDIAEARGRNPFGRSMPGRGALQKFLHDAVRSGCEIAIIEMTSEGARQYRHAGIALDMLIFLNLAPEHIESHGSYEAYADAKFMLGKSLVRSRKHPRTVIANRSDSESVRYLALPVESRVNFSLKSHSPNPSPNGGSFVFDGKTMCVPLPGLFSLLNALAAAEAARALGVPIESIQKGLENLPLIEGRAQKVDEGQDFAVVVDYAHTPDSLAALCEAYAPARRICILGSAGGGRDTWKRPVMARTAEEHCARVILTTDDPYDDDPATIAGEMAAGMKSAPEIILDRRLAIRRALQMAAPGDVVLITGKGTDPIYGKGGAKIPWNDIEVAREEIRRLKRGL